MMTRRIFMGVAAAATAAAGFGLGGILAERRSLAMAEITPSALASLRNRTVNLHRADGRTIRAVLEDAVSVKHRARFSAPATEQVSLVFAAAEGETAEGTYRVEGSDLSLGNLYLTAVGGTGRDRRLEAVITRIV